MRPVDGEIRRAPHLYIGCADVSTSWHVLRPVYSLVVPDLTSLYRTARTLTSLSLGEDVPNSVHADDFPQRDVRSLVALQTDLHCQMPTHFI